MADALRQLLAQFVVQVDPDGALKKGEAQVDALKAKFQQLDQQVKRGIGAGAGSFGPSQSGGLFARARQAYVDRFPPSPFAGLQDAAQGGLARMRGVGSSLRSSFSGALSAVTSLRAGIAGLVGGLVVRQVKHLVDEIGGIGEEAARLGVTNAEFQRLKVLAAQNATSVGALGTAFRTVGKAAVDGTDDAKAAFSALGVQTKNSDGTFRSRNELFFDSALALADIQDETKRATVAQQLFGRSAIELLPLLASGRAGIQAQRTELEKLPIASDSTIEAADRLSDRWQVFGQVITGKAAPIIEQMIPHLEDLTTLILDGVQAIGDFAKESQFFPLLATTIRTFATPFRVMFRGFSSLFRLFGGEGVSSIAKLVSYVGKLGVAFSTLITFPALLADDVQGYLDGKDSVTGRMLEGLKTAFGAAADAIREAFASAFDWLVAEGSAVPSRIAAAIAGGAPAGGLGGFQFGGGEGLGIPLPPGANGSTSNTTVVNNIGERSVTIQGLPAGGAKEAAALVGSELERDRTAILAQVGG
jgi:hypothetical protein